MTSETTDERPVFPVERLVGPDAVWPVPYTRSQKTMLPGPWMPGTEKPARDGRYLRYFDDCDDCAFSEFHGGKWTKDGFWESDIQDAPWRGGVKPGSDWAGQRPNAQVEPLKVPATEAGS